MPNGTFRDISCSSSSQFPASFPKVRISVSSIDASLGFAIGSDVANASATKTFFAGFASPSNFSVAFAQIMPRFGEDSLAVPGFQTIQPSIFTSHELVAAGVVIAGLLVQISHHNWSKTTGVAVIDCHHVFPHLCTVRKQMLQCSQLSHRSVGHMEIGNFWWRQDLPAVVQTSSSCTWVAQGS